MKTPSGNRSSVTHRTSRLRTIAACVVAVLFVKVLLAILYEYRWYFPADFDSSSFLIGRRDTFFGLYRTAFYAHIISGPVAIVVGAWLMLSGGRLRFSKLHRWAGRTQILIVLAVVVPSGFVMGLQATAGPIAAYGFATLSIATAVSAAAAVYFALARKFQSHQRWAGRCFVLLCSPLLLRLISGALIVLQLESDWFYRLNAWISWLIPLMIYEAYLTYMSPLPRRDRAAYEITLLSGGSSLSDGRSPMTGPLLADARLSQRESEAKRCNTTT